MKFESWQTRFLCKLPIKIFFFFESYNLSGQNSSAWNFEGEKICVVLGFETLKRISRSNSPRDVKSRPKRCRRYKGGKNAKWHRELFSQYIDESGQVENSGEEGKEKSG